MDAHNVIKLFIIFMYCFCMHIAAVPVAQDGKVYLRRVWWNEGLQDVGRAPRDDSETVAANVHTTDYNSKNQKHTSYQYGELEGSAYRMAPSYSAFMGNYQQVRTFPLGHRKTLVGRHAAEDDKTKPEQKEFAANIGILGDSTQELSGEAEEYDEYLTRGATSQVGQDIGSSIKGATRKITREAEIMEDAMQKTDRKPHITSINHDARLRTVRVRRAYVKASKEDTTLSTTSSRSSTVNTKPTLPRHVDEVLSRGNSTYEMAANTDEDAVAEGTGQVGVRSPDEDGVYDMAEQAATSSTEDVTAYDAAGLAEERSPEADTVPQTVEQAEVASSDEVGVYAIAPHADVDTSPERETNEVTRHPNPRSFAKDTTSKGAGSVISASSAVVDSWMFVTVFAAKCFCHIPRC